MFSYLKMNSWTEFLIGTVLYKTKSLDGTKPNTNPKTNPNPNTNPIQLFYDFFEHRPIIFKLASFVRFSHHSKTVLLLNSFDEFGSYMLTISIGDVIY